MCSEARQKQLAPVVLAFQADVGEMIVVAHNVDTMSNANS